MIIKKILSLVASIISFIILQLFFLVNSNSESSNSKYFSNDNGILSVMYHRFNENKYPSTNVRMEMFEKHLQIVKELNYDFYDPSRLISEFEKPKERKKILITIDDGFKSFYNEAWPYLKKNKIPFILFISTEPVGKKGYMDWKEIKEVEKFDFATIGHHSHTHEYLIEMSESEFIKDIETATKIFKDNLGYVPEIFSYPFGEYSEYMKKYISKNFKIAFGQHSGVIDINKNKFELPRFPINEKYGDLKRFKSLISYLPLEYKKLEPIEKKIEEKNNPPQIIVTFFPEQKYIKNINCYANDGGEWSKPNLKFENEILKIDFDKKFLPRRGRINCSLNDNGKWRWFGTQFTLQ